MFDFDEYDDMEDEEGEEDMEEEDIAADGTIFHRDLFDIEANMHRKSSLKGSTGFYYTNAITGIGTMPLAHSSPSAGARKNSLISRPSLVTKREFSLRLKMLANHRKWVERAARQSSIGFNNKFHVDDKHAEDKFLVCLAGGIIVRKHQAYKSAEEIRLYSTTGCREICWEKPQERSDREVLTKPDRGVFDCCIAGESLCERQFMLVALNTDFVIMFLCSLRLRG